MVLDVLIIASVVGTIWWWRSRPVQARHARGREYVCLLPYEDLPPIGSFEPVPEEHRLDEYVETGLRQLDSFLSGRDSNA